MSGNLPAWKLEKPLADVCNAKASGQPMMAANAGYAPLLRQKVGNGSAPVDVITKQLLLTALCTAKDKAPSDLKHPPLVPKIGPLTGLTTSAGYEAVAFTRIRDFNDKTDAEQKDFVDEIWKRLVDYRIPDTKTEAMVEHNGAAEASLTPLPSSLAPSDPNSANVTLIRRDARPIWKQYGIGFRVEGARAAGNDDMARILAHGPAPLLHNRALMRSIRGWAADGTYIEQRDRIFFWWGNEDVLNESATCVSRSLFGATALPDRQTDTAAEGKEFHYLLAVGCAGQTGTDTEAWQLKRGAKSVWRPGEKAFLGVGAANVLGWTKLLKEPNAKGWRFRLPENAWNWINRPSGEIQDYLTLELRAWRSEQWYNVDGAYDFGGNT